MLPWRIHVNLLDKAYPCDGVGCFRLVDGKGMSSNSGAMSLKHILPLFAALMLPAAAAVSVSFSGGQDLPLSISVNTPATYMVQQASEYVIFVFDDVGSGANLGLGVSGTITYSVNDGPAMTINLVGGSIGFGALDTADWYIYSNSPLATPLAPGDRVTIHPGTLSTSQNYNGTIPASGSFGTFIAGGSLEHIGVEIVPEPSAALLGGLGVVGLLARRRRGV